MRWPRRSKQSIAFSHGDSPFLAHFKRASPLVALRSFCAGVMFRSHAAHKASHTPGAGSRLRAARGGFGGYGLYLLKGKPVFLYNLLALERFRWQGDEALAPGTHTIVFDFKSDEPGFGKGGAGVLKVDGKEVANQKIPHTIRSS
jgi:hypothetical protein